MTMIPQPQLGLAMIALRDYGKRSWAGHRVAPLTMNLVCSLAEEDREMTRTEAHLLDMAVRWQISRKRTSNPDRVDLLECLLQPATA